MGLLIPHVLHRNVRNYCLGCSSLVDINVLSLKGTDGGSDLLVARTTTVPSFRNVHRLHMEHQAAPHTLQPTIQTKKTKVHGRVLDSSVGIATGYGLDD
jgi:hypothetical protein